MEQLLARLAQLECQLAAVCATPWLHRKDVQRLLGISERTLDRRMKRRDFPKPVRDAGRPKWRPNDFPGQPVSG